VTPVDALQRWLALEHEAVWLYPVVGARVDRLTKAARRAYGAHVTVRDELTSQLERDGVRPVGTALAYDVGPLDERAAATEVARGLEQRIAAACLTLVGVADGDLRDLAMRGLRRAALEELRWGGAAQAFPGMP
jgi:hypothetical protein